MKVSQLPPKKIRHKIKKYFSHRVLVSFFFRETVGVMSPPKAPPPNPKEDLPARPREKEREEEEEEIMNAFFYTRVR